MIEDYSASEIKSIGEITAHPMPKKEMMEAMKNNFRPYRELMAMYNSAMMEIETKLKVLDSEYSLDFDRNPIESIKTRLKSAESIVEKLKKKDFIPNVHTIEENLADVAGVRVICSFVTDIYTIADCLLKQDDIKLIQKRDYIKSPKENGYRSLHLIVEVPIFLRQEKRYMKVEIQLRTIAMDFWASLEHKVRYKKGLPKELENEIFAELASCATASANLDLRMEDIKNRICDGK